MTGSANGTSMLDAALAYRQAGLCVLPALRQQKRPALSGWKTFQERLPTERQVHEWFNEPADGLCIVTGAVSGHLEMIDFDCGGDRFAAWCESVPHTLLELLVVETSQSGGKHVAYRCAEPVCGNMKLAQGARGDGLVTLIETRGEGGLFLCAPTPGYVLQQGSLTAAPLLSAAQRELLLEAAWELNEHWPAPSESATASYSADGRPGDDYNERGDVRDVLTRHGWTLVKAGDNEYWRRPGKTSGWSATLKDRVFYVFSGNTSPFEPDRAYAPFTVFALLEHGGDFRAAAAALRTLGFGLDLQPVDLRTLLATDCVDADPMRPPLEAPGPLPDELLRVPGFVSEVMDYCLATAPYPNQVMAFSGAIALQAFLSGRKVRDPGDNRTNLYLLGLAHSAAGKDWPRKVNTRILHEIGAAGCLGERFASGEGVQDALFLSPSMLFQTDEIDGLLQSINKARDARYESIMTTLLTLYSCANSVFPMRRKAGKDSPGAIDQPSLVIFGTAIPNHYYEALSERMLTNGFFARMIILECGKRGSGQEPQLQDIPTRVLETARWWNDFLPGTGNLQDWHPLPAIVQQTPEARRMLVEARLEAETQYERAENDSDAVGTTVWGRVSEQIRKLALLYAISERHESPEIGCDAVEWAMQFVLHQTQRMLFMAAGHVAKSEFDAKCKELIRVLQAWRGKHGDEPMPEWEVNRRLPWKPKDHEDVRTALMNQRRIQFEVVPTKTKPRRLYWLIE